MSIKNLLTQGLKPQMDLIVNSMKCKNSITMEGGEPGRIDNLSEYYIEDTAISKRAIDKLLKNKTETSFEKNLGFNKKLIGLFEFKDENNFAIDSTNNIKAGFVETDSLDNLEKGFSDGKHINYVISSSGSVIQASEWITPTLPTELSVMFYFRTETQVGNSNIFSITDKTVDRTGFLIYLTPDRLYVLLRVDGINSFVLRSLSTEIMNDGEWRSVSVSTGSQGARLYIDGVLHDESESTDSIATLITANTMTILGEENVLGIKSFYAGCLDRLAVFEMELDESQILKWHQDEHDNGYAVIPLLGQSNMVGKDSIQKNIDDYDKLIDDRVYQMDIEYNIEKASQPIDFVDENKRVSCWKSFCENLIKNGLNRKILLVPAAVGGSGFQNNHWNQGDDTYNKAVEWINEATDLHPLNGILSCLWIQGETDNQSELGQDNYYNRFMAMIAGFENEIDQFDDETPFILSQVNNSSAIDLDEFNNILNTIGSSDNRFYTTTKDDLLMRTDETHFTAPSIRTIGKRMFSALSNILNLNEYNSDSLVSKKYLVDQNFIGEENVIEINRDYGNVKANSYSSDISTESKIILGSIGPSTTKQITYPTTENNFVINFSSSPTQTVPYPDRELFDWTKFYDGTNNTFLENKVLGQTNEWRIRLQITKASNQTGGFEVRLYNQLSGFELGDISFLSDGITDFQHTVYFRTIADDVSLPSPLGTGQGYNMEVITYSGITLTNVVVTDITRTTYPTNKNIPYIE